MPKTDITVKLVGTDGNAFAIMGIVKKALRRAGADREYCEKYMDEAISGDYNNVLATTMKYVKVK